MPLLVGHWWEAGSRAKNGLTVREIVAILRCNLCLTHRIGKGEDDGSSSTSWFFLLDLHHRFYDLLVEAVGRLPDSPDQNIGFVVLQNPKEAGVVVATGLTDGGNILLLKVLEVAFVATLRLPDHTFGIRYYDGLLWNTSFVSQKVGTS